jgi:ATP-dependent Clp protease ATP-binding subunit ClpB
LINSNPQRLSQEFLFKKLWDGLLGSCRELANIKRQVDEDRKQFEQFKPFFTASKNDAKKNSNGNENAQKSKETGKDSDSEIAADEKALRILEPFTIDLTSLAERGELDPIFGRDEEVRRVVQVLGRRKKNNPILLGEPGVGKTAIAEGLALRIISKRVPENLKGMRLMNLNVSSIVAGSKYRGEFEEKMKSIIEAARILKDQVIFFIDEIHTLIGSGNQEGGGDAANLLKPALARGEFCVIGATTLSEFRQFFEKDAALERRFQPIIVEEPSIESTLAMLRGIKARYEAHHGVRISDDALSAAVRLSVRFFAVAATSG